MEPKELIEKYNIDIEKLEQEQLELSKKLEIKDKIDFSLADRFAAVNIAFIQNKILASIIISMSPTFIIEVMSALSKSI